MTEHTINPFVDLFSSHPIILSIFFIITLIIIITFIYLLIKSTKSLKLGDFEIDLSKSESIKGDQGKNAQDINEVKRRIEENTRHIIVRQFEQIEPFLQSLRPIFNRLVYSIAEDAINSDLGIEKETRTTLRTEPIEGMGKNSYYKVEEVKTYVHKYETRTFSNLVESSVDSMLRDLQLEIFRMLVANNIGKTKEEVYSYVKARSGNLVGIIRNNLCDTYNYLSNKNLFDTKKYWAETGISYPEDWIIDNIYNLLKTCMSIRYSDFEG